MPNDNEESFENIDGQLGEEEQADKPDFRTRPYRAPETVLTCPNCDETSLAKQPYSKQWACPCGYTEER